MTINYTTLLGLAQPVTGTESGTWGTVVNDEITALVEQAVAGGISIDVTAGNVTLTDTDGVSNQARNAILLITGTPGTSRNIVAPSSSKVYLVKNGSNGDIVLKGSATTGVTIGVGVEALCFWNGSDFEIAGVAGPSSSTDNAVVRFDGTTGKIVQNSAVTIADTTGDITGGAYNKVTITAPATSATLTIANGKTLTANNSLTLAGTDSTTMTFPATNTTLAGLSVAQTFTADQTITGNLTMNAQGDLRFADADSSNWVAFQAPATVASNVTWTLPSADGTSGQVLQTNGSGTLSFTTPTGITTGKSIAMALIFGF